jgi:small subunit ribosomal protein S2
LPDAVFLVDLRKEQLGVREARRLGIPVIGLVDTNCDPDDADFVIPGNDDAIRACSLIVRVVADGIAAGSRRVDVEEFAANGQPEEGEEEASAESEAAGAEPEAAGAEPEAAAEPEPAVPAAEAPASAPEGAGENG